MTESFVFTLKPISTCVMSCLLTVSAVGRHRAALRKRGRVVLERPLLSGAGGGFSAARDLLQRLADQLTGLFAHHRRLKRHGLGLDQHL